MKKMNQVKQLARTIIMTGAAMLIIHALTPEILAVVDRQPAAPTEERPLRMIPLGTQEDYSRVGAIRNERELALAMMNILGGGGVAGRGTDTGIALDADEIEVVEADGGDWETIEVPASLIHDDYSTNAYVGNMAPDAPDAAPADAETEEIELTDNEEEQGGARALKLQGTIHGAGGEMALIGGEVYMEGDTLGGYEVVRVGDRRVIFRAPDGAMVTIGM